MKKILFASLILLVGVAASHAATTISDASLKGKYSFQLSAAHYDQWQAYITCPNPPNNSYTVNFGGSDVSNESILGVVTFDGKGNATGTFTQYGQFDQAESNATVVTSCTPGGGNNGHAVYDPPSNGTFTGIYTIQPTGTGTMVLTIPGNGTVNFVLELAGTAAVRTSVLMTEFDSNNRVEVSGSATLQ